MGGQGNTCVGKWSIPEHHISLLPSPDTTLAAVSSSGVRLAAQGIEDAQGMGVRGGDRHTGVRTVPAGTALGCPGLVF